MRRKSKAFCRIEHLELRRLLSTIYVSAAALGTTQDGTSWATAYKDLQQALAVATTGTTIEVGMGTYYPTSGTDRTATFQLEDGVEIEGGYAGYGADNPDARNVATYPTILSGDIGTPRNNSDNSYHVVTGSGTNSSAVLDGFTVADGNADGAGTNYAGGGILDINGTPTLNNCTISGNTASVGGGMYNHNSSPTLTNCTISGNTATSAGGGILNIYSSSPTLTNCTISGNTADDYGGGIFNAYSSSPTLTNCTISGNTATSAGGGIFNAYSSSPTLTNCTISGNSSGVGAGIVNNANSSPTLTNCILWGDTTLFADNEIENLGSGTATITYSDIDQSGYAGSNIDSDPLFISSSNLRLQAGSPAIGAGNAGASGLSGVTTDLDGFSRTINGKVDMGAYESHWTTDSTVYVDASATAMPDGESWQTAYPNLSLALIYVGNGDTVEVAQGIYYPTAGTDRTATFQLKNGVTLQGGYAGDTTANPGVLDVSLYPTILSGDIGTPGNNSDNSYHVVTGSGTNSSAVLDGFTITGGNANGTGGGGIFDIDGSPTLDNCTISGNAASSRGGGMFNQSDSSPSLTNCTIIGNTAGAGGGGICNYNGSSPTLTNCTLSGNTASEDDGGGMANYGQSSPSSPTLTNCTISGNTAGNAGGGMYTEDSSPELTNCIITANTAGYGGGGLWNGSSSPILTNCTLSGNTASVGGGMADYISSSPSLTNCILWDDTASSSDNEIDNIVRYGSSTATITYSDIAGGYAGTGNINADPMFVDAASGNFQLQNNSPVINAGSNAAIPSGTTTDLAGNARIVGGIVDMGAYEYQTIEPIYVDQHAAGLNNGTSWANAFTDLQSALQPISGSAIIDVAQGTYKPTTGTSRTATFQLKSGVTLQGGYAGDTTSNPGTLDIALYPTLLSGDIGTAGNSLDNSYHVVTGSGTNSSAVLDGFTVTDGNANGNGDNDNGGGIFDNYGSPTLDNCTITGNAALGNGGGMFNANSSPKLTNCAITENTASNWGGGMYNETDSFPNLINCILSGNTANRGGGIYNESNASPTLTNCTISGNAAANDGGGMFNDFYSSPTLTNCTISGNTALNGGGVANYESSFPTLVNCILWGDTASSSDNEIDNIGNSAATITYSDIEGGYAGAGNINADPQFIRNPSPGPDGKWGTADDDYGDLHLQFTSPCIDAGSNAAVPAGITTDLDGNARIFDFPGVNDSAGATVDMGAYELGYNLDEVIVPSGKTIALPTGGYCFTANQLVFQGVGALDIADDTLTIGYQPGNDPIALIALAIGSGYDGGQWRGAGIISSAIASDTPGTTAVGYYDTGSQVIIRRSWVGDANLDGTINADDLSLMMLGQTQHGTRWQDGNFNYGTQVNADDWSRLFYAIAYSNGQNISNAAPAAAPAFSQTQIASADDLNNLLDS